MASRRVDSILDLVGDTPLVRINRLCESVGADVYAKLEFMNPGGSVKDRPALRMIEAAELRGELTSDKIVLEATSGNTGIGLAMVCAVKGYRMLFTMSESASEERRKILRAYGADIRLTPAHMSTDGAIEEAYRLARKHPDRYFLVDQFNNDDNWHSHYEGGTADEVYQATDGQVRVVVATLGTSGTAMGMARRLHELNPEIRLVAVEPYKGHRIQGLKNMLESYAPGIYDASVPDAIVHVDDDTAYETARRLAREEGIFVGMSAGAAMKVAIDEAAALDHGTVVALLADGGERYLSTPLFVSERVPVPLRFHNTLTRQMDDLVPVQPGHVGIYACGPSLDGPPDLGLCRRMVFADLLRRYLEFRGFDVDLVTILGDVDDRTVDGCLAEDGDLRSFTDAREQAFLEDMRALAVRPAHRQPRASDYIPQMVDVTRELIAKGYAYEKLRSVYFDIGKFERYGALSGIDLGAIRCGKTVNLDTYEKDDPRDFTLFKRSTLAELKAGIYWRTPWGNARPGWHVECATIASQLLGLPFDLHLASADLTFPHGEDEIAIAEAASGERYANIWLHSEVVMADGRKISRAMGNDVTLRDLQDRGFDPLAIRYWLLSQHYRRVLQLDDDQLRMAERSVRRLNEFVARLGFATPGDHAEGVTTLIAETRQRYCEAMDRDLNVARAHAHLFSFVKAVNRLLGSGQLDADQIDEVLSFMRRLDGVLGFIEEPQSLPDPAVDALVGRRAEARAAGDFATADHIRDELAAMGVQLQDGPQGTRWSREG